MERSGRLGGEVASDRLSGEEASGRKSSELESGEAGGLARGERWKKRDGGVLGEMGSPF